MSDLDPTRHMAWNDEPEEGYGGLPSISGAEYERRFGAPGDQTPAQFDAERQAIEDEYDESRNDEGLTPGGWAKSPT